MPYKVLGRQLEKVSRKPVSDWEECSTVDTVEEAVQAIKDEQEFDSKYLENTTVEYIYNPV